MSETLLNPEDAQTEANRTVQGEVVDARIETPNMRKPFVKLPDYLQGIKKVPTKGTKLDIKA